MIKSFHIKIHLCFLILLVGTNVGKAQDSRADSLFAIWSDTTNSAAQRVEAFYQRFNPLESEADNPEARRWSPGIVEVQQLAKQLGKTEYLGRFMLLEGGTYYFFTPQLEKGCALALESIELSLKSKDYPSTFLAFLLLRGCNANFKTQEKLEPVYDLLAATLQQDTLQVAQQLPLYLQLVHQQYSESNLPEVLRLSQKMITIAEEHNIRTDMAYLEPLGHIAAVHQLIGNLDEAEKYGLQALKYGKEIGEDVAIGRINTNIASLYVAKQDIPKAKAYLDTALTIMQGKKSCEVCMMKTQRVKAEIYNLEGKYQEALAELQDIQDYYKNANFALTINRGAFYSALCETYFGLRQFNNAIASAQQGIYEVDGNLYSSIRNYEILHEAYLALNQQDSALKYYKKYISARDAITDLRSSQEVNRQDLAFQFEKKRLADSLQVEQKRLESELILQRQLSRQKNNRNISIVLGLMALLLALGIYYRYRLIQKTKAELEVKNQIIEAEKEKAKASEQAKHQFLANMSHEIRTPMNAIKGMTDILLRRDPKKSQLEYLDGIKQSSDSLLVIIDDILDISKIEAGKIDLEAMPFSVGDLVGNVKTIMQLKADEKGLGLQVISPENIPLILGDPTRLQQVLINLVGNAIKFTSKGLVTIQVRELLASEDQLELQFTVSDTGIGMDKDRLEKIFESFTQAYSDTSRKFGGTGLGLSISKRLVELHGGKMWVESEKGKGSQFHFIIPYPIAPQETLAKTAAGATDAAQFAKALKGIKILLVEDNYFNAVVAQEELEDAIEDIQVDVAENGAIAVEKFKTGQYQLVLMDVQMPVMNGYEATEKIKSLANGQAPVPIIAMTANVLKEEVELCKQAGMDDFVGKPFDIDDLVHKIYHLTKA